MRKKLNIILFFVLSVALFACNNQPQAVQSKSVVQPEWAEDAVLYEVNIRQYTPEGTFNAFAEHLPRLKELGVEILWIMPVNPISEKNRKGSLGSYYSIADYTAVNPEFGTMDDFKNLVAKCHKMGFKVIIDWVANHTGWDNHWITEYPEWYTADSLGNIIPPVADWSDVADLNYDVPQMRRAMIDAMDFWLEETDIDGFRCDVAWGVPQDFWEAARASFDSIKPAYMLAEDEDHPAFLEKAFQSNYAWKLHHLMNDVAQGKQTASVFKNYFTEAEGKYMPGSFPMQFITNHDENSWQGTIAERMGAAGDAFAVFSFTIPGIPLIYSGQEAGLSKRLLFFEKDEIDWNNLEKQKFYKKLVDLKTGNKALWNGDAGGDFKIPETTSGNAFCFVRERGKSKVLAIFNFSSEESSVGFSLPEGGTFINYFSGEKEKLDTQLMVEMPAWGYKIYIQN
ncbi:MAG: alpha-amylase [Bacteroidetes bacterium GWF2_42_66]|nr:MAG: alpha-amylase [Bacteroidetes bacterium GWA2_42_15]OFX96553.1 MAG: alpha-amylase [Bacteroidetes bacterium GWE2_42_39]OFY40972.1 MAG: alpha-amylase [Bacteroidetes bacterium GWF2_42_66]